MTDLVTSTTLVTARRAINRTLTWRGTIARTNLTTPCRISWDQRPLRVEGLPSFIHVPRWKLTMQDETDLRPGDQVAAQKLVAGVWASVAGYVVAEVMQPTTISVATTAFTAKTFDENGIIVLPFPPNASITFKRPVTAETIANVPVFIRRADHMTDPRAEDGSPAYQWHMMYPLASSYTSDASKPGVNHYILWSELNGAEATIAEHPDRTTNQFFGLASLYFSSTG